MKNKEQDTRPRRETTLRRCLRASFHNQLTEEQAEEVIAAMKEAGVLQVSPQGTVKYENET
jgi:hypothetical protein